MKNVLFIAYHFPPSIDSGAFRPFKLAKYLKKNGNWNPIIVSIDPAFEENRKYDFNYEAEFLKTLEIHRVKSLTPTSKSDETYNELFYEVQFPERQIGAFRHFLLKCLEIINNNKIDAIFCTCPPYSMGLVGVLLKEITGIPLVMDFRDGWLKGKEVFNKIRSKEGFMINSYYENLLIEKSDVFITVEEALGKVITNGTNQNYVAITNGFDLEDFGFINEEYAIGESEINLVWCGRIYEKHQDYLLKFCNTIQKLNSAGPYKFKFTVCGDIFQDKSFIDKLNQFNFVNYLGRVSNKEAIYYCKNADVNVVIDIVSMSVGSKVYNLIPSNRPIYFMCDYSNSFSKNFLNEYSEKMVVNKDIDQVDLENSFLEYINHLTKINKVESSVEKYNIYDRRYHANKLEELLDNILENRKE